MNSSVLPFPRDAVQFLTSLVCLLSVTQLHAWVRDTSGLWPDGTIEIHLQLAAMPIYQDGNTPNSAAKAALDIWNPLMERVQFAAHVNSNASTGWDNDINNVIFGTTAAGKPLGDGVLAITLIASSGNRRTETDVVVNSAESWNSYRGAVREDVTDIRRVLIHEFGHVLGLDHPDEDLQLVSSIMNSFVNDIDSPTQDDLDGIGELYGRTTANPGRPPVILYAPGNVTVEDGQRITLEVTADGTAPLLFQWHKDGQPLQGETTNRLSIPVAEKTDAGDYYVTVSNAAGTVASGIATVVVDDLRPPRIDSETGGNLQVTQASTLDLYLSFEGSNPLQYQWYHNDQRMPDETHPSLHLRDISADDAGTYYFKVTNPVGSATSAVWTVTVSPLEPPAAPSITSSTLPLDARHTNLLSFDYHPRTGITYQWYHDGVPIPGETAANLAYSRPEGDLLGEYNLVATNAAGSTTTPTVRIVADPTWSAPAPAWKQVVRGPEFVYFRYAEPARIERFDLKAGRFVAPIPLMSAASAMTLLGGKIYYSVGHSLRRVNRDGTADEELLELPDGTSSLFGLEPYLYAVGATYYGGTTQIIDTRSLTITSVESGDHMGRGFSVATDSRLVFNRTIRLNPGNIASLHIQADGSIGTTRANELAEALEVLPTPDRTWLFNEDNYVVDNTGNVFATADLRFIGKIHPLLDVIDDSNGQFWALRGGLIERFDATFKVTGRQTLSFPAQAIAKSEGSYFAFRSVSETEPPDVEIVDATAFTSAAPIAAPDPAARELIIDDVMQDRRGQIILHSRLDRALRVWSPDENRFTKIISLQGAANTITYSLTWNCIVVAYADGRLTTVDLNADQLHETYFAHTPGSAIGMVAAGDELVLFDPSGSGSGSTLFRFNKSGKMFSWKFLPYRPRSIAWDQNRGGLLFLNQEQFATTIIFEPHPDDGPYDGYSLGVGEPHMSPPLFLSPDNQFLLLGSGTLFSTAPLSKIVTLASDTKASTWVDSRLYTARLTLDGTRVERWDGLSGTKAAVIADVPGNRPHLFNLGDQHILLVTQDRGTVVFSVFNTNLEPLTRVTHRGGDLLGQTARLSNLSTRVNFADTGDGLLVGGFVVGGSEPLKVLIRAVGPGLSQFEIPTPLANPSIKLFNGQSERIAQNDDWGTVTSENLPEIFAALGAFSLTTGSRDAALVVELSPGVYSAHVDRGNQEGGTVLLELYDASPAGTSSRLVNLSTRMRTGSGDEVLTAGFVITGESEPTLLMRAVGPSLERFSVPGLLADPVLIVREGLDEKARNDNWNGDAAVSAASDQVGAFEFDSTASRDAALLITLPPGAYTAQVTGREPAATGITLIEVYRVDE